MVLRKKGRYRYGESRADIRFELQRYSEKNAEPVSHFADVDCRCSGVVFSLLLDDEAGVARRICVGCGQSAWIGDSEEYAREAEVAECACPCGAESFEITVGVSLYAESEDVRWLYLGARCTACGLTAVYGDWKNEGPSYRDLLSKV